MGRQKLEIKKLRSDIVAKDSQIDNKTARKIKSRGNSTIATEGKNHNKNSKKQSIENNDV